LIQPWRNAFLSHPFVVSTDIVHLHNLHGSFFPITILPQLSQIAPIVWTLHDTWAMTGHCSYNYECERWQTGCGSCPNLSEHPKISIDTTAFLWRVKDRLYRKSDICIVVPSKWLFGMASQSPLLNRFAVHCIPYGIDTQTFHPIDRALARQQLELPADAFVMMIIVLPQARRKGAEYFVEALHKLKQKVNPWLLVVGSQGLLEGVPGRFRMREVGNVRSAEYMNLCYCAADLFVLPTLADNLPLSLLEALAAGTPAVAFNIGGVPDIVRHMETGYLARYMDPEDLARGIVTILTNENLRTAMRLRCKAVADTEYSLDLQSRRYQDLYEGILRAREMN